jgi:hypothetical protein
MSYLRRSAPKTWQHSCGEYATVVKWVSRSSRSRGLHKDISPTSHGDKGKSKYEAPSQITVATLSKFDMAHEFESVIARNMIQEGVTPTLWMSPSSTWSTPSIGSYPSFHAVTTSRNSSVAGSGLLPSLPEAHGPSCIPSFSDSLQSPETSVHPDASSVYSDTFSDSLFTSRYGTDSDGASSFPSSVYSCSPPRSSTSIPDLISGAKGGGPESEAGETAPTVCTNCQTTNTPLWRRDPEGQPLCKWICGA